MPQYKENRASADPRGQAQPTHLGRTRCFLCGEVAGPGESILGPLVGNLEVVVAACGSLWCFGCENIIARYPDHCWCHGTCWSVALRVGHHICVSDVAVKILWESVVEAMKWRRLDSAEEKAEMIGECLAGMEGTHLERLPMEVLTIVGHYLVNIDDAGFRSLTEGLRLYQHAWSVCIHGNRLGRETEVSLIGPIYMALTRFHGTAYICGISKIPFRIDHHLVLGQAMTTPPREPRMVLLGCNQNGVGDIQFLESRDDRINISKYPWYKLTVLSSRRHMSVSYNGIFLSAPDQPSWNVPIPRKTRSWNQIGKNGPWNYLVDLTAPGMKGLVVPYLGDFMVGIHAFCGVNDSFREFCLNAENIRRTGIFNRDWRSYQPVQRLTWWFFPMRTGEYLNKVWVCGTSSILLPTRKLHTLVVSTNTGRLYTFGQYLSPLPLVRPLVCEGDGPITAISYSVMTPEKIGICKVGVHCSTWASTRRTLVANMDAVHGTNHPPNFPADFTSHETKSICVRLEGIVSIRIAGLESDHGFTGLLLHYSDGRSETLGEVDLSKDLSDYIDAPIESQRYMARVPRTNRTVFRTIQGDYPWPTGLQVERPRNDRWIRWPTTGTVAWISRWHEFAGLHFQ